MKFEKPIDTSKEGTFGARDPVPAGQYIVCLDKCEEKKTKAGDGHYLACTFKILRGEHEKRLLFTNLNLDNPSQEAVKIARQELSAIGKAVGVLLINSTEQLMGKPLQVKVKLKTSQYKGQDQTSSVIAAYYPMTKGGPKTQRGVAKAKPKDQREREAPETAAAVEDPLPDDPVFAPDEEESPFD